MITDSADQAVLDAACSAIGLDDGPVTLLKKHATGIYLHEAAHVVIRISRGKERERGRTAVAITRWLNEQDFPAPEPLDVAQPFDLDDTSVTFWRYYPQGDRPAPEPAALGVLLRQLHCLPEPPISLASYRPLVRLGAALERADHLPDNDREWLGERRAELLAEYDRLESQLGRGFIHGDAYPGNVLWDGDRAILGDWDEVARGPRELDLVNTHQGVRFGRSAADRSAFTDAYGWDVTSWRGFPTLRSMRDLHTLAVFIERAAVGDEPASAELRHRIVTLRRNQPDARWQSA